MSWVNTLLDIGILSMQVNQKQKLEQLQSRQIEAAMMQTVVQALREYIFKFKQAAEEIVRAENQNPLVAAGAIRILEARLLDFGIAPEMFPDLSDKEYVASTIRLIRDNSNRMTKALPVSDQEVISQVVEASLHLPEYNYYVDTYQKVQKYQEAKKSYKSLEALNSGCLMTVVWLFLFGFTAFFCSSVAAIVGGIISDGLVGLFGIIGFLGSVALLVFAISQFRTKFMRPDEFKQAHKVVKDFENQVDLKQFQEIEKKLGTDLTKVQGMQEKAEAILSSFFGNSTFDQLLPG